MIFTRGALRRKIWIDAANRGKIMGFSTIDDVLWNKVKSDEHFVSPDVIFFTHCHGDHFSKRMAEEALRLWPDTYVIIPENRLGHASVPGVPKPQGVQRAQGFHRRVTAAQNDAFHCRSQQLLLHTREPLSRQLQPRFRRDVLNSRGKPRQGAEKELLPAGFLFQVSFQRLHQAVSHQRNHHDQLRPEMPAHFRQGLGRPVRQVQKPDAAREFCGGIRKTEKTGRGRKGF